MIKKFEFKELDPLFQKITQAIVKGCGPDFQDSLSINKDETRNASKFIRGDKINTNLRNYVTSDTVELWPFMRSSWEGRLLIDRVHKITITICTKRTFMNIKRSNHERPHYLMSLVHVENSNVSPQFEPISLFSESEKFSDDDYREDYRKIMGSEVLAEDGYHHLVVVYERSNLDVTFVAAILIDKNLSPVAEYPFDKFLKPDFNDLTAESIEEDKAQNDIHSLVKVKTRIMENEDDGKKAGLVTPKKEREEKWV